MCVLVQKKIKRRMRTGWKGFVYTTYLSIRFYLRDEENRFVCIYALRGRGRGGVGGWFVLFTKKNGWREVWDRDTLASGADGVNL